MNAPAPRINEFRAAVVASIKTAVPRLSSCEELFGRFNLDELERSSVKVPSVQVSVLDATLKPVASGQFEAELRCAAFVITEGRGTDRDRQAWAIAEIVAALLHTSQRFALVKLTAPQAIKIQPVISGGLHAKAVSVIAVEWKQNLLALGGSVFDGQGVALPEVYLNDELQEPSNG